MADKNYNFNKHYRNFDIVRYSKPLKNLVQNVIQRRNIDPKRLCEISSVNYNQFTMWMNSNNPYKYDGRLLTQSDILQVCKQLGINIRLTIIEDAGYEVDEYIISETKNHDT